MSYTNAALVRNHIEFVQPVHQMITNQRTSFTNNDFQSFFNGQIVNGSVVIKSLKEYKHQLSSLIVTDGENVISNLPVVDGSVFVHQITHLLRFIKKILIIS